MTMYGLMFGENDHSDAVLATLGLTKSDVGRFRDVSVDPEHIAVYTRNGGGNRQCWERWDDESKEGPGCECVGCFMTYRVQKLPHYSHDKDDEFDSTYATIYFTFPDEYADGLKAIASGEKWDPDERWAELFKKLEAASSHDHRVNQ